MNKILAILILLCPYVAANAQHKDSSIFQLPVAMDEVVVKAARGGWDVQGFISRVQRDTTFFKAFRTSRIVPYSAVNDIKVLNDKGKVIASLYSKTKQDIRNGCRSMQVLEEKTTGKFYKSNGSYNYYTAELYAYLFFTKGEVCGDNDLVKGNFEQRGRGKLEKSKYQLKQLIFNPGSKIEGVPFMGDKAAIFDPQVSKMYNFSLKSQEYNGIDCYVFSAVPKPGYEDDVVYNELTTWFRKSDYSIVARDYSLSYKTLLYDFDVDMKVRTGIVKGKLVPYSILYDGNWHVFSKKRERVRFSTTLTY
jgi:hypothetical protein